MRRAGKIDSNQPAVVEALRKAGCSVQHLSSVGKGCPDLLVGFRAKNILLEVKDGDAPKSQRVLTKDQVHWHAGWCGTVYVVESPTAALDVLRMFE